MTTMMMAMMVMQKKAQQTALLNSQKLNNLPHRSKQEAPSGVLYKTPVFSYSHDAKEMD